MLAAHTGFVTDFEGSGNSVSATHLNGARPFSLFAPGIDDEAFVIGIGTTFDVSESVRIGGSYAF